MSCAPGLPSLPKPEFVFPSLGETSCLITTLRVAFSREEGVGQQLTGTRACPARGPAKGGTDRGRPNPGHRCKRSRECLPIWRMSKRGFARCLQGASATPVAFCFSGCFCRPGCQHVTELDCGSTRKRKQVDLARLILGGVSQRLVLPSRKSSLPF